jgi:hypothetical protein
MTGAKKEFGKRGVQPPPVVMHAPEGLPEAPDPLGPRQLRTLTITVGSIGATVLALIAATEALHNFDQRVGCDAPQGPDADQSTCRQTQSSGGGHGGGSDSSWHSSSGSGSGGQHAAFGGFGGSGGGHGGGGGE